MESTDIDQRKKALRAKCRQLRGDIPPDVRDAIDDAIYQQLIATQQYHDTHILLTYLSFGAEVDTWRLIRDAWADGKTVALPRCVEGTRSMEWFIVTSFDNLVRNPLGMDEPRRDSACLLDVGDGSETLAIVPGLSFDLAGNRIGYGGGFYDTFLSGFVGTSVGLCRECQLTDDLAELGVIDTHDRTVQLVVTERRVIAVANQ